MKEIIGAMIGTTITHDRAAIATAIEAGTVRGYVDREWMQFLAACDVGERWRRVSEWPTLFCVDNGKLLPPDEPHI